MTGAGESEIKQLKEELRKERYLQRKLQQSLTDLETLVSRLEHEQRLEEAEDIKWQSRYKVQTEVNQQLSQQAKELLPKVNAAKNCLSHAEMPKQVPCEEESVVTPDDVKKLEQNLHIFEGQLRHLEWRLDQQSKAYHHINKLYADQLTAVYSISHHDCRSPTTVKLPAISTPLDRCCSVQAVSKFQSQTFQSSLALHKLEVPLAHSQTD